MSLEITNPDCTPLGVEVELNFSDGVMDSGFDIDKRGHVYVLKFKSEMEVFYYVGQTINPASRLKRHQLQSGDFSFDGDVNSLSLYAIRSYDLDDIRLRRKERNVYNNLCDILRDRGVERPGGGVLGGT